MGAIWRRTQNSIVYRRNHFMPNYLRTFRINKRSNALGLTAFSHPPKLNHVLAYAVARPIFWVARITTLANNPRLEHIKSRIRTFPAHFLCWWSWTYVSVPFFKANVSSALQIMSQSESWIQWFEWNSLGPFLLLTFEPAFRLSIAPFLKLWASLRLSRAPVCHIKHVFDN